MSTESNINAVIVYYEESYQDMIGYLNHIGLIVKATWNNQIIAESDGTIVVENNHYFPADSIKSEFFTPSEKNTRCPWKGKASYYSITVGGEQNPDAAWYYPEPKRAAIEIKDRVAFWRGVEITE